jgi:hypothetical protein
MYFVAGVIRRLTSVSILIQPTHGRTHSIGNKGYMVLLHAFVKKSQKTPRADLDTEKARKTMLMGGLL